MAALNNNNNINNTANQDISECCSLTLSSMTSISNSNMEITIDKYQRLATEYAKIRAQLVVLKKAVIDEQNRNQELQQSIKSYDQNQRRLEQELQSIMFRNQQLTKRVQVLQSDLQTSSGLKTSKLKSSGLLFFQHSSFSTGNNSSISSNSNNDQSDSSNIEDQMNLIDELNMELKCKTEQTEHLRQLTIDLEHQHQMDVKELEEQIKSIQTDLNQQIQEKHSQLDILKSSLFNVQQEKCQLQTNFNNMDQELKQTKIHVQNLTLENDKLKERLKNLEELLKCSKQQPILAQQPNQTEEELLPEKLNGTSMSDFCKSDDFNLANERSIQTLKSQTRLQHNKLYKHFPKRKQVIEQFAQKLSEFICALSTLHSNISQKILIMFALFNKNSNHLYFLDFNVKSSSNSTDGSSKNMADNCLNEQSSIISQHRSLSVMSILKKFRDYLKLGYDTYLVHLEDGSNQYSELKIRQQELLYSMNNNEHKDDHSGYIHSTRTELNAIEQEITETSIDIVETFADYVSYLNKLNIYLTICLNMWSKQYRHYDPNNPIIKLVLEPELQIKLADRDKRQSLCEKNEILMNCITTCIKVIGQICNHVQLLLSKSLLKSNFLPIFNQFMHRVDALEHNLEETKRVFSSKVVLEHDLGITVEPELKSMDDCILSSLVFVSKCVQQIRLTLEMHYFFFVDQSDDNLKSDNQCEQEEQTKQDQPDQPDQTIETLNNIQAKLKFCQNRLLQVEKEKEHWSIESQLNLVKLEREQKRCQQLEERLEHLTAELQSSTTIPSHKQHDKKPMVDQTPMVWNKMQQDEVDAVSANKVDKLISQMQMAESRAMAYWNDCQSLRQRFIIQVDQCQQLQQQLIDQQSSLDSLREEYRTSVSNYEEKLQAMSEHMAALNETLTKQSDQIHQLKMDNIQTQHQDNTAEPHSKSTSITKNLRKSFISTKRTSS